MKWRLCAVLALALACDKESIYENTRPLTPGGGALPSFDGGFALDAGLGTTDAGVADNSGPFSKAGLLRALGDCALQRYRTFAVLAEQLRMAVRAYGETLAADRRDDARRALLIALTAWQELEMFRFGPAGGSGEPGGRDL
ncbi:MAG: imelysin family protein, partial [Polyangiales bacterium]